MIEITSPQKLWWKYFLKEKHNLKKSKFELIILTLPVPITDEERKLPEFFIFTLFCGASRGFMNGLKTFIKPFEASQRSAKIKI